MVWYGIGQALSRAEDTKIGSLEADRSGLSEQVRSVSVAKVHQLCGFILLQFRVILLFCIRFGTVTLKATLILILVLVITLWGS